VNALRRPWHDAGVPRPFVAYLRVYEPLSAFDSPSRERLEKALEQRVIDPGEAGDVERQMWLSAQLATPPRMLPGDTAKGESNPHEIPPVLVLRPEDVPSGPDAPVADGPLVCPLDLRPRSAAALVGFLATATATLREAALPASEERVRAKTSAVMAEVSGGAVHVVSSTWTVPLPWFTIVDPATRTLTLAPRDDPARRVCWRAAMADARRRVAKAYTVTRRSLGEEGPTRMLRETGRWLEHFHPRSAVELDYGGLVQLLDDDALQDDTSAEDVQHALRALEDDDAAEVADRYARLQEFWGALAAQERCG
jgi:hypothetical protein